MRFMCCLTCCSCLPGNGSRWPSISPWLRITFGDTRTDRSCPDRAYTIPPASWTLMFWPSANAKDGSNWPFIYSLSSITYMVWSTRSYRRKRYCKTKNSVNKKCYQNTHNQRIFIDDNRPPQVRTSTNANPALKWTFQISRSIPSQAVALAAWFCHFPSMLRPFFHLMFMLAALNHHTFTTSEDVGLLQNF